MTLNLIVPTCWQELTQKQLRYVYYLIAQGFSQTAVQTYCLCRWAGLEIICPEGDGYRVRHAYNIHHINAEQLTEVLSRIDWLNRLPIVPLRLLTTMDGKLLDEATPILYGKSLELLPEEQMSIFYWLSTVKQYFSRRWNHLFVAASNPSQPEDMQAHLQNIMDTQIRALTKGDITKEREVLQMDVHRALTELDAQAKEYEELKRETKSTAV